MNGNDTPRRHYAAAEWSRLRDRLRTITPQAIARAVLTVAVVTGATAIIVASWPAFLPFVFGGIVAYGLLPVVDALDRVMPRALAAAVSVVAVVGSILAIVILVMPPLARTFVRLAVDFPTAVEINAAIDDLQRQVGTLPEGSAAIVAPVVTTLATTARDILSGASGGLDDVVKAAIGALLNAVGALLGLIVLPAWMLTMMTEKRRARTAIDGRIAPWLRKDLWAVVAIADRAAGAYVRGYVVVAALVGLLTYLGLILSGRIGGPVFQEPLALSVIAGTSQVVPIVGPIIGLLPGLLILPIDPTRAGIYLLVYVGARILGGSLFGARLMERRIGVHPAILVPGVVMIGQFGILWLLLSAPIVAIAVDVVRYLHGRLSEPAKPAGVLPWMSVKRDASQVAPVRVSSTYRPAVSPAPLGRPPQATTPPTA
jgi:predicted PurR-regulated permease PerM